MPKSRCDLCGKRIGPARYELGLCPGCEKLVTVVDSFAVLYWMIELLSNPELIQRIERESQAMADAIRLALSGG